MQTWYKAIERVVACTLIYFWAVVGALVLNYEMNWQYDGNLGWWLVAGLSYPVLWLVTLLFGRDDAALWMCLAVLSAATIAFLALKWRQRRVQSHLA